jgi:arsenate reductase
MSIQSHPEHAALRAGAEALAQEFAGTFNTQTITRFLESSYDDLAASATTLAYLPVLAERFARERLTALARLEGHHPDGKPVVLFLCVHNAGRSQMALGFFHHYEPPRRFRRLSSLRLQRLLGSGGERSERPLPRRA